MGFRLRQGIVAIFLMTMMLFLVACDRKTTVDSTSYTITFDTDGGTQIAPISFEAFSEVTLPTNTFKEGYTFLKWHKDISNMPLGDLTLKALWQANEYVITFDTNGGTVLEDLKAPYQSTLLAPTPPTKEGHTFKGWDMAFPSLMPLDGLRLEALWQANEYSIIFDTKGGSMVETIQAPYLSELTEPVSPTKPGYIFKGWNHAFPSQMPLNGLALSAVWEIDSSLEDMAYSENFELLQAEKDAGNNFSEYQDFDWTGSSYVIWEVINGRIDLGLVEGGNAITIGGYGNLVTEAGMGRIMGTNLKDGIKQLSFDARLPFSPKSTYPQGPGADKAINVKIKVFINDELIDTLKFADDNEANKGKTFVMNDLNVSGNFTLSIEISSGHRMTLDNIKWTTFKQSLDDENDVSIDFESDQFDFDTEPNTREINGIKYVFKEVHTLIMHEDKELAYMDSDLNGSVVARFRGNSKATLSTPTAFMYTLDPLKSVSVISFDARLFGSLTYFSHDSVINLYFWDDSVSAFTLITSMTDLNTEFTNYQVAVNKTNVKIKIEVINGSVNIDNISFQA